MKSLKNAYLRVSVDTRAQLEAVVREPAVDLVYLDAACLKPEKWRETSEMVRKGTGGFGKLFGLRLPRIWKTKAETWFTEHLNELSAAQFDIFLAGCTEEVLWLLDQGIPENKIVLDAGVYQFNSMAGAALEELLGTGPLAFTWPEELNRKELSSLSGNRAEGSGELIVYGRTPLMTTAQCLRKTTIGCDRRQTLLWMKDRTGTFMPVRNRCIFCMNTIYNSVPTVLFDLEEEITGIRPGSIRYEFTSEDGKQVHEILSGKKPENFTRGHFRRGVM